MMHLHGALEESIAGAMGEEARLRIVTDEQLGMPRLEQDLRTLGLDPATVAPSGATAAACAQVRALGAKSPVTLLGSHYVLEGSKNGNRYIAMALRRGLGLSPGDGDTYLDPYGEEQRAKWQAFRTAMGAQAYTPAETDAVIAAAGEMFDHVSAVCAAIM
jgi:heme oxygenase